MWPLAVVVVDEDAEDVLEVAAVEDQQPVQALGSDSADKPSERPTSGEARFRYEQHPFDRE